MVLPWVFALWLVRKAYEISWKRNSGEFTLAVQPYEKKQTPEYVGPSLVGGQGLLVKGLVCSLFSQSFFVLWQGDHAHNSKPWDLTTNGSLAKNQWVWRKRWLNEPCTKPASHCSRSARQPMHGDETWTKDSCLASHSKRMNQNLPRGKQSGYSNTLALLGGSTWPLHCL